MADVPTFEAKNVVVTTKFACAAASPSTRGAISRATSSVGASPRLRRNPYRIRSRTSPGIWMTRWAAEPAMTPNASPSTPNRPASASAPTMIPML